MKTKTWLILGVVVVCGAAAWALVCSLSGGVPVEAAAARRGLIQEFVDERAVTRLPETYMITMPAAGRIEAIKLTEGTPVKEGQVVARIVPRDLELAVEQATAAVDRLEASIRENADVTVEETACAQAVHFVKSMGETVKAAAARVDSGRARFDFAEKNLGRINRLVPSGAKTQEDADLAGLRMVESAVDFQEDKLVHAAMLALEAATNLMPTMVRQYIKRKDLTEDVLVKQKIEAEARLKEIKQTEARGTMTSPVDGVVLKRLVSNEGFLPAGAPLLEIGQLDKLEVEADLLSLEVVGAKPGDPVRIYGPAVGKPDAHGSVERVYPAGFTKLSSLGVEQQRVKVIVRIDPEDHERLVSQGRLGVGYRVRVQVFTAEKPDALVVPRSALFRDSQDNWQVYAIRDGRARIQTVKVGLINDKLAEIASGLSDGEQVVLAPESNLSDGARVKLQNSDDGQP